MREGAGTRRAPPLWAWLAVGAAVDGLGLAGLFWLGILIPKGAELLFLLGPALMMVTAWLSHAVVLPKTFGALKRQTLQELFETLLAGTVIAGSAALAGYFVAGLSAFLVFVVLSLFATLVPPPGTLSDFYLAFDLMIGAMAGGAVAGSIAHAFRFVRSTPDCVQWRLRSDATGSALAAALFTGGLFLFSWDSIAGGVGRLGFVLQLSVLGTLALLPHLALLWRDLSRVTSFMGQQRSPSLPQA